MLLTMSRLKYMNMLSILFSSNFLLSSVVKRVLAWFIVSGD